ncbi:22895_t:CDS:2, partial [Cetraspora pellucida]
KTDIEKQNKDLELEVESLNKQVSDLTKQIRDFNEPEKVVESFVKLWNNLDKKNVIVKGLPKSTINSCLRILNELRDGTLETVNFEELKNNYEQSVDKEKFIKELESDWVAGKLATTIKKHENCTKDIVMQKRCQYFLLGNYIICTDNNNNKRHLKFYYICYERVAKLCDVIGHKFSELPLETTFFTGRHDQVIKVDSLIQWFIEGKECDDNEFTEFCANV